MVFIGELARCLSEDERGGIYRGKGAIYRRGRREGEYLQGGGSYLQERKEKGGGGNFQREGKTYQGFTFMGKYKNNI